MGYRQSGPLGKRVWGTCILFCLGLLTDFMQHTYLYLSRSTVHVYIMYIEAYSEGSLFFVCRPTKLYFLWSHALGYRQIFLSQLMAQMWQRVTSWFFLLREAIKHAARFSIICDVFDLPIVTFSLWHCIGTSRWWIKWCHSFLLRTSGSPANVYFSPYYFKVCMNAAFISENWDPLSDSTYISPSVDPSLYQLLVYCADNFRETYIILLKFSGSWINNYSACHVLTFCATWSGHIPMKLSIHLPYNLNPGMLS